ncbi:hypothetical protein INT80_04425 [Gallibacterium anatis]|uniref:Uncharacterized protein n=1 Tax=Gallibacterium anatis TaxID=750 RepID=A0A930UWC7_9PAST|nr:hypothetical protein [Gallibacterium anatis]
MEKLSFQNSRINDYQNELDFNPEPEFDANSEAILQQLAQIDPDDLTPKQALAMLYQLKNYNNLNHLTQQRETLCQSIYVNVIFTLNGFHTRDPVFA